MATPTVTVLVAEASALLRHALAGAIDDEPDLATVGQAADCGQVLAAVAERAVDVVVVDAGLPPAGGVEVCAAIKAAGSATRVLVLGDDEDQEVLQAAVEAGADGYLTRAGTMADMATAIRRVRAGEASIPPGMLGLLLRSLIERRRHEDAVVARFSRLSRREREVLELVVEGYDNQSIASALYLSPHTARTHIQNLLEKLEVHSRLEAAALVREHNLVERFSPSEDAGRGRSA